MLIVLYLVKFMITYEGSGTLIMSHSGHGLSKVQYTIYNFNAAKLYPSLGMDINMDIHSGEHLQSKDCCMASYRQPNKIMA